MNIFTIGDLHLSHGTTKPMDVFYGWEGYVDKLSVNWEKRIKDDDMVIIPGDISWAINFDELVPDLDFLEKLPGKKLLLKGNHDYWWQTSKKLRALVDEHHYKNLIFLHNDALISKDKSIAICGGRGWKCPGEKDFKREDEVIYKRELLRLELSLKKGGDSEKWVFMHFPPFNSKKQNSGFLELLYKYEVTRCFYGHLHAQKLREAHEGVFEGFPGLKTEFKLVSGDRLNFNPLLIKNDFEFF
ncbi:MAG: metallophosphoesterase [Clostridiales bacterium]|jgi:predicted phosphohydrolase|nr:metallophosphoesterase [Clostridiales bacterium]